MSGKVKSRGSTNSANTLEAATTTLNERILKVPRQFVDKQILKKPYICSGVPHIVCGSRAWADLHCGDPWPEVAGAQEEDHHHAHRKPFGRKIIIHQLVCHIIKLWCCELKVVKLCLDWAIFVGTLKSMCSGQGWQLRLRDSHLLHRAGLQLLPS